MSLTPVLLTRDEVRRLVDALDGTPGLAASSPSQRQSPCASKSSTFVIPLSAVPGRTQASLRAVRRSSYGGYAAIGCANSEVHAERQGQRVVMEIVAKPIRCLAIYSVWEPYRAELLGLEPGIYEVRVSAPVHAGEFRGTVSLESGQP